MALDTAILLGADLFFGTMGLEKLVLFKEAISLRWFVSFHVGCRPLRYQLHFASKTE